VTTGKKINRCSWCGDDPLYVAYHDEEWGVPVHDDRILFEYLTLESAQAGLSWITVLRKREHYREAFADFDPEKVARFTKAKIEKLLLNPGIVRNRMKDGRRFEPFFQPVPLLNSLIANLHIDVFPYFSEPVPPP
jgi:hypothetical protein